MRTAPGTIFFHLPVRKSGVRQHLTEAFTRNQINSFGEKPVSTAPRQGSSYRSRVSNSKLWFAESTSNCPKAFVGRTKPLSDEASRSNYTSFVPNTTTMLSSEEMSASSGVFIPHIPPLEFLSKLFPNPLLWLSNCSTRHTSTHCCIDMYITSDQDFWLADRGAFTIKNRCQYPDLRFETVCLFYVRSFLPLVSPLRLPYVVHHISFQEGRNLHPREGDATKARA